ncbi:MAG: DsbA family protein, partial [Firmicutes bacterium]|nr:DsbA family protein [Bacillota bacterium]
VAFTDPVCTWCWGSEPVLRKLQVWYGNQIRITPVMGGLVEDIREFYDSANAIGGDPEKSNAQIARHWLDASARHGMPVQIEGFRLFSKDTVSTYSQNIAYKAVELCNSELASKFLRRVREASAAEARETGRREVLIELANEVGVDVAAFISLLDNDSAAQAFRDDLARTRHYGVRGFPTFMVRWGSKELMLRGYQSFNSFSAVISSLSEGQLQATPPEKTTESILNFVENVGRAATVEITSAFELSLQEWESVLNEPSIQQKLQYLPAGNGGFWELRTERGTCDPVTRTCAT